MSELDISEITSYLLISKINPKSRSGLVGTKTVPL
jgi:hypothetical protein